MSKKVDILQHVLVPAYKIVGEEEVHDLITKYNIKRSQLPRMFSSDPIVKKISAKVGDIIEVTRKSQTAGTSKYYRVVVDG
jgi:DNA-directed RNA polymerase subunit H